MLDPAIWNEELLKQYSADMSQFVGLREYTLNGQRALHLYNAVGLEFIILPDRGFDIWDARYKGIPLTWLAAGSPHPPDAGAGWLRGFNGGLLTTCGLTHVGPAETDPLTGERSDIHGSFTRLRARNCSTRQGWIGRSELGYHANFELELTAELNDAAFFGPQLSVFRTYSLYHDRPSLSIHDYIINNGDTPAPLMLLYHFNLGYPLVKQGAKLHASGRIYPRDDQATAGLETWDHYDAPSAGFAEQVFYHHLNCEATGWTEVLIGHDALALQLAWDTTTLPYFTQWKNTRLHQYVNGIEPGNCIPEGRSAARQSGRLKMLQPGEQIKTSLRLTLYDNQSTISALHSRMESYASVSAIPPAQPIPGCDLSDLDAP